MLTKEAMSTKEAAITKSLEILNDPSRFEMIKHGYKYHYKYDGKNVLHRVDGPAVEGDDGSKHWYVNGRRHREDGPATEEPNGRKFWYINDMLHREDGPAIEVEGHRGWFLNGKQLRTLTKEHLIKYMEANNLTIAHLLTDPNEIVRTSAAKYKWKKT
jgi:hypothetical protein